MPQPASVKVKIAALLVGTCLAACSAQKTVPSEVRNVATGGAGRFAVVPVAEKDREFDHDYWYAWRIDTETGDLEFCTMDSGNLHPTMELHDPGGLSCTPPAR